MSKPYPYISGRAVRELAKGHNRRVGKVFLEALNRHVEAKVEKACEVQNGGKITLDVMCAAHVGLGVK